MTIKQAIEILDPSNKEYEVGTTYANEARRMAVEALNKRMKKLPVLNWNIPALYCPSCGEPRMENKKYCPECGQAIDN